MTSFAVIVAWFGMPVAAIPQPLIGSVLAEEVVEICAEPLARFESTRPGNAQLANMNELAALYKGMDLQADYRRIDASQAISMAAMRDTWDWMLDGKSDWREVSEDRIYAGTEWFAASAELYACIVRMDAPVRRSFQNLGALCVSQVGALVEKARLRGESAAVLAAIYDVEEEKCRSGT